MRTRRWLLASLPFAALAAPAFAQQLPAKPITLVVPYAAGGNVDISTRILQAGIGNSLGQPIIIRTGQAPAAPLPAITSRGRPRMAPRCSSVRTGRSCSAQ